MYYTVPGNIFQQSESQLESMLKLLPRYAEHVFSGRPRSLMTRFFGIYRITPILRCHHEKVNAVLCVYVCVCICV